LFFAPGQVSAGQAGCWLWRGRVGRQQGRVLDGRAGQAIAQAQRLIDRNLLRSGGVTDVDIAAVMGYFGY
jgi:hypothetical protein